MSDFPPTSKHEDHMLEKERRASEHKKDCPDCKRWSPDPTEDYRQQVERERREYMTDKEHVSYAAIIIGFLLACAAGAWVLNKIDLWQ